MRSLNYIADFISYITYPSPFFVYICDMYNNCSWWSGGHSDSIDPDSYKEAKLSSHGTETDIDDEKSSDEAPEEDTNSKEWDYIRVDGLGFIPGLCCPHHDRVQSNGILRATDVRNYWR
jgi:hypothetical protein